MIPLEAHLEAILVVLAVLSVTTVAMKTKRTLANGLESSLFLLKDACKDLLKSSRQRQTSALIYR